MTTIDWVKNRSNTERQACVHEAPIFEIIFVTLTENSSVIANDTQGPRVYPHQQIYLNQFN